MGPPVGADTLAQAPRSSMSSTWLTTLGLQALGSALTVFPRPWMSLIVATLHCFHIDGGGCRCL